ncbi:ABC transporter ATP-binding protein [Christensenella sp. MSJ-20]|uniref:ABC transporter ATP-binding protein n=1 Tax=Christensenella sp. MSJ-20 TaxID=2841518 RepID=UPI001C785D8F|nr:ABC transporter ATP-binding protein [Christensenella sp. MSJ-20]
MEQALSVRGLRKQYDGFSLRDVSFDLPRGSIMGLIGENGAGKTTTISAILGLINPDAGRIEILGKGPDADVREVHEKLGVVLDEFGFHGNLTIQDIDAIMARMYRGWSREAFRGYCKRFGLTSYKAIKTFSRGMKTKLSIAVAISHDAELLILDEATSGLDPVVRNEILDIFLEFIQDKRRSILISSQITSDLERVADYITFFHRGEVVLSQNRDELLERYGVLRCGLGDFGKLDPALVEGVRKNQFGYEVLVRDRRDAVRRYPNYPVDPASLEEIVVFYVRGKEA